MSSKGDRQDLPVRSAALFKEVVLLAEEERAPALVQTCGGDLDLLAQVARLLVEHRALGPGPEAAGPGFRLETARSLHGDRGGDADLPWHDERGEAPEGVDGRRSPRRLRPGDRLGDFAVESFLARGGTSEVYRARQGSLGGRPVALKVLLPEKLGWRGRERFFDEAQVTAGLHHPHLVPVYGCGEDEEGGTVYYAMRLVEGPTLQDVLGDLRRTGPPAIVERKAIVRRFHEIALALGLLHDNRLVHGDVKPANIVLEGGPGSPDDDSLATLQRPAVLVDLGLVRGADQIHSTVWATPSYAAPEVLTGGAADARSDVFSLGLSLHDLLAARSPESRRAESARGGRPADVPRLSRLIADIDPDLEAVVAKATDPDPVRRYSDAAELARDLGAWLAGEPVVARRLRGLERVRRWVRRHPGRVLGWTTRGIAAALLLAVVLASWDWGQRVIGAVNGVNGSWQAGDLDAVIRAQEQIPPSLQDVLLADEPARISRALREGTVAGPLEEVARCFVEEGDRAALFLAASHVEAEGARRHPFLADFLLHATPQGGGSSGKSIDALLLLTKIFTERLDLTAEDSEASRGLRDRCLAILDEGDEVRGLQALSALSGCGIVEDVPRIHARLMEGGSRAEAIERMRLGLRCLARIIERAHAAARPEAAGLALETKDFVATAHRILDLDAAPLLCNSFWSLHCAVNLARRAADLRVLRIAEAGLVENVADTARAAEVDGDMSPFGEAFATPVNAEFLHDEVGHLGARLSRGEDVLAEVAWPQAVNDDPFFVASWDFRSREIGTWGAPSPFLVSATSTRLADVNEDRHLGLLLPGVSRARFEFVVPESHNPDSGERAHYPLSVRIVGQKSIRELLPGRGKAPLEIRLGGRVEATTEDLGNGGLTELLLPLSLAPIVPGERHQLTITLLDSATTQAWIGLVEVVLVNSNALEAR